MNNWDIRQLSNSIIDTLNASPAPIEIKRLIMRDITTLVEHEADKAVREEKEHAESVQQDSMGEQTKRSNATE